MLSIIIYYYNNKCSAKSHSQRGNDSTVYVAVGVVVVGNVQTFVLATITATFVAEIKHYIYSITVYLYSMNWMENCQ